MKRIRIDTDSAINASPVTIAQQILDVLVDASESPEAQITFSFKKHLDSQDLMRNSRTNIFLLASGRDENPLIF